MEKKKIYQLFVIVCMLFLLTCGVLIGLLFSKSDNIVEVAEEKTQDVKSNDVKLENNIYEESVKEDIEIVYVDIYEECNHSEEIKNIEYDVNMDELKERELEKIQNENSGYKLVKDKDGTLMFEKVYNCKCKNHYLLKLENNVIIIYRNSESNEYEKYQETNIQKENIRPDMLYRLDEGIEAESLEELYMFLEDLES